MFGFGNPGPAKSDTITDPEEERDQVEEIKQDDSSSPKIVKGLRQSKRRSSVDAIGNQRAHKYYHNSRLVTNIESIYEQPNFEPSQTIKSFRQGKTS